MHKFVLEIYLQIISCFNGLKKNPANSMVIELNFYLLTIWLFEKYENL